MSLKSGHSVIPLTGDEAQKQHEDFHGYTKGTIRLQPDGWFFPSIFAEFADKFYDFKFKSNDVVVMTYPKCGTTWTQEIVWTILNNPNLDNPKAVQSVNSRCPFLEFDFIVKGTPMPILAPGYFIYDMFVKNFPERKPEHIFLQMAELAEEPRVIKTHLPFSLFPESLRDTCKVIYVARNPKDVAVSFCHHSRLLKCHDFQKDVSEFVDHFVNDTLMFGPYWTHLKEAWSKRNHSNVHYLFYEDMKANPKIEITRLQNFLGVNLTENQIDNIVTYTTFNAMKTREENSTQDPEFSIFYNVDVEKKDGGFLRKGIAGDWKNKLSTEEIAKIDGWTKRNTEELDKDFKYKPK